VSSKNGQTNQDAVCVWTAVGLKELRIRWGSKRNENHRPQLYGK